MRLVGGSQGSLMDGRACRQYRIYGKWAYKGVFLSIWLFPIPKSSYVH